VYTLPDECEQAYIVELYNLEKKRKGYDKTTQQNGTLNGGLEEYKIMCRLNSRMRRGFKLLEPEMNDKTGAS
jgi:hypothetical protein